MLTLTEEDKKAILEVRDGITFLKEEFEAGDQKGFSFARPYFLSKTELEKVYDEDTILTLANEAIGIKLRAKVKNSFTSFSAEDEAAGKKRAYYEEKRQQAPNGLVFSIEDALTWKPGQRELTVKGWFKAAQDYAEEAKKATLSGNAEEAMRLSGLMQEAMQKAMEKMASL